jgi:hypothetical protein
MLRQIGSVLAAALVVAACQSTASLAPTTAVSPTLATDSSNPGVAGLATASAVTSPAPTLVPTPTPGPSGCVNPPPNLATVVALDPPARLACFGAASLSFTAIVSKAISDCGIGPRVQPGWFCLPGVFLDAPSPPATTDAPALDVYWNPASGLKPASFIAGASVEITGHFDDPAALTCHVTDVPAGQSPPTSDQVILACRETFIVSVVSGGG